MSDGAYCFFFISVSASSLHAYHVSKTIYARFLNFTWIYIGVGRFLILGGCKGSEYLGWASVGGGGGGANFSLVVN